MPNLSNKFWSFEKDWLSCDELVMAYHFHRLFDVHGLEMDMMAEFGIDLQKIWDDNHLNVSRFEQFKMLNEHNELFEKWNENVIMLMTFRQE